MQENQQKITNERIRQIIQVEKAIKEWFKFVYLKKSGLEILVLKIAKIKVV